jgi:hypothetical protein
MEQDRASFMPGTPWHGSCANADGGKRMSAYSPRDFSNLLGTPGFLDAAAVAVG